MFRRVKIQPISLPEADKIRIACCQIAPGSKSNAFSGPTRSISCPWIVPAKSAIGWVCTYLILRLVQLQNLTVSTSSLILSLDHNIYVFPPFILISPVLGYPLEQDFHGAFTIVVPDLKPRRLWWALLQSLAVDRALLGRRNEGSILWYPSQGGQEWFLRNLQ